MVTSRSAGLCATCVWLTLGSGVTGAMMSEAIPVTASTPFKIGPVRVPGTIEAENFDAGGEGIAYHDLTAGNTGGAYPAIRCRYRTRQRSRIQPQ